MLKCKDIILMAASQGENMLSVFCLSEREALWLECEHKIISDIFPLLSTLEMPWKLIKYRD